MKTLERCGWLVALVLCGWFANADGMRQGTERARRMAERGFGDVLEAEVWVFETSICAAGGGANLAVPVYRNTLNGERVMWAPGTPDPRWLRMGVPGS